MNTINLISIAILTICLIRYCFSGKSQSTRYQSQHEPIDDDESDDVDDDRLESKEEIDDEEESETMQPSPLTVIQDLESDYPRERRISISQ